MKRFCYVILQYGCSDLTAACVRAIRKLSEQSLIVVVDNCSPDDAASEIRTQLDNDPRSYVLEIPENVGFSSGNNAGVEYAQSLEEFDYCVVLNSDVVIEQPDFEGKVAASFEQSGCAVLGPDILVPSSGWHQNPFHHFGDSLHPENPSLDDVREARVILQAKLDGLDAEAGQSAGRSAASPSSMPPEQLKRIGRELDFRLHWDRVLEDTALQGACLVFSAPALKELGKPFSPVTFLYCEEWILRINCSHHGLRMKYDPSIKVLHHEGSSTARSLDEKARKKKRFTIDCELKSLDVVERLLEEL